MKTYYGYGYPLEVEEDWYEELMNSDREIANNNKRHRRRKISLDAFDHDDGLLTSKTDVAAEVIRNDEINRAFAALLPEQKTLVRRKHLEGYQTKEIAAALGVDKSAISHKDKRALERMKKILVA